MKKLLVMTVLAVAVCTAAVPEGGKKAAVKASSEPLVLPKDAVANPDGTWSYTDKLHKQWIYMKTPFGVSRTPAVAAATKGPAGIPAGARKNPDGTYAWTDQGGKKWTLKMTPFGVSRVPVDVGDQSTAATAAREPELKAIDQGDTVRFERKGPMGNSVWEKKKTELTDDDRRILAAQSGSQK